MPVELGKREHALARQALAEVAAPAAPHVGIVVAAPEIGIVRLMQALERIRRIQHVQRQRMMLVEAILHLAREVVVSRRTLNVGPAQLEREVDIAASRRHHPLAVAAGELTLVRGAHVGDAYAERRERLRFRELLALHRQHAREPVAVVGREAARHEVDATDRL